MWTACLDVDVRAETGIDRSHCLHDVILVAGCYKIESFHFLCYDLRLPFLVLRYSLLTELPLVSMVCGPVVKWFAEGVKRKYFFIFWDIEEFRSILLCLIIKVSSILLCLIINDVPLVLIKHKLLVKRQRPYDVSLCGWRLRINMLHRALSNYNVTFWTQVDAFWVLPANVIHLVYYSEVKYINLFMK